MTTPDASVQIKILKQLIFYKITGEVNVYQLSDNEWIQIGYTLKGEKASEYFGRSVSLLFKLHQEMKVELRHHHFQEMVHRHLMDQKVVGNK